MTNVFKNKFHMLESLLKESQLWDNMTNTVENSPWHREDNVAVHTDMVVNEFIARTSEPWSIYDFAGAAACLFHDVGKPPAMVMKFKEERGHYKAFHGHEKVSAREFVNFVMSSADAKAVFTVNGEFQKDIFFIVAWMIEHHLPWDIKDKRKRESLMRTCHKYLGGLADVFMRVVLSDTYGRTSDDQEIKRAKSNTWVDDFTREFNNIKDYFDYLNNVESSGKPKAYVLIGASGSGKSTFRKQLEAEGALVFSLDDMRHELYGEDYDNAFIKSVNDPHFKPTCRARFIDMARLNKNLIIDNTSCTKKSRVQYVDELQRRKYDVVGVVFMTSKSTVVKRQKTRKDKEVPAEAVIRQYDSVELPSFGEFDKIEIVIGE